MNKYIYLLPIILICACGQSNKEYVVKVKPVKLTAADIYNKDMVTDFVFDAEEQNINSLKTKSHKLFLQGIDAYKNKKDLVKAVNLFRQSILVFPEAKTYYEMGNVLLELRRSEKQLQEIEEVYKIAEALNFQPLSMLYYKLACTNSRTGEGYGTAFYLKQAFEYGFSDTTLLYKDKNLQGFRQTDQFESTVAELLLNRLKGGATNPFELYKKAFIPRLKSFEVTTNNVDMKEFKKSISYDFAKYIPEMENVSFGRDVSNDFFYVAKVAETENYTALLYTSINYYGEEMQPVHTKLVTYTKAGDIIASTLFSGQFSAEKIKTGKIEGDKIVLQDYKRIWKQPIDKVSFDENQIDKYEPIAKASFHIDNMGRIIEDEITPNYVDSVTFAKN